MASPTATDFDVDKIISKLLEVKESKPGKPVNLSENDIKGLCMAAREVFISQPILLELEAPLKVCGNQVPSTLYKPKQGIFTANIMTY